MPSIHDTIQTERKAASPEANLLRDFRAYARGRQKNTLTQAQYRILRGVVGKRFCDNVCKQALTSITGRLQLARFDVGSSEGTPLEEWLRDFWVRAGLAVVSNQVQWATLRDGNHALALSWDDDAGMVRLTRERWWDGKSGVFVAYDEQDRPTYAVKEWKTEAGMRRVLWYDNRIERYRQDGEGWKPYYLDPANNESWRSWWTSDGTEQGEPLGMPVVHFRNIYMPNDSSDDDADSSYGVSELDGGVLGLQDEVNDVHRDLTSGGRYTGYQMLWATGYSPQVDDEGNEVPPRVEPGAFFTNPNPAGSYGTLPAGDLSQLDRLLTIKLQAVARVTATPLHEIKGGDWPSGEALLQADQPLIKKAESIGAVFAPAWGSVAHRATVMANTFGGLALDTDVMISAVYMSPDKRDKLTQARVADALAAHVSRREVLRELGKGPGEQDKILDEIEKEAKSAATATPVPTPANTNPALKAPEDEGK